MLQKEEIRVKALSKIACSFKQIFAEISAVYQSINVSYDTVHWWKKKFDSGLESIENAPKSGRPRSACYDNNVSKEKEIVERDASYTVRNIAQMVGFLLSRARYILKNILNVRKISARWVPHLLSDSQKKQRVKTAKQLLKIFPKYDEKKLANVVTGDETRVHYFQPVRKFSNKIWATKNCKRPVIATRTWCEEGFVCNLLLWWMHGNTGASEKGQKHHWKMLQRCGIEEIKKKILSVTAPQSRVSKMSDFYMIMAQPLHLPLLHIFCKKEKVTVLPHTPYSPDLAPCDFFLFFKIENLPLWMEISVQTGACICHIPAPY